MSTDVTVGDTLQIRLKITQDHQRSSLNGALHDFKSLLGFSENNGVLKVISILCSLRYHLPK